MDFESLPDEMLASFMKYLPYDKIQELRRISSRMNRISTKFRLNRFEVRAVELAISDFCVSPSEVLQKVAELKDQLLTAMPWDKDYLEPLLRLYESKIPLCSIASYICEVYVVLKNKNGCCEYNPDEYRKESYSKKITRTYADEKQKIEVLDDILSKLRCTEFLVIGHGKYDMELEKCLRRNKNLYRNARFASFRNLEFKCSKEEFMLLKDYKNPEFICFQDITPNPTFILEEVVSEFSAGITLLQGSGNDIAQRKPENFGDERLMMWTKLTPFKCNLRFYRNNFSLPKFQQFLLKFIQLAQCKHPCHFGILSSKTGSVHEMEEFFLRNLIGYSKSENQFAFEFEITQINLSSIDRNRRVKFEIEKDFFA